MTDTPSYTPEYPTEHIRTSLKPNENHPSEAFAVAIFNAVPREYVEFMATQLSEQLGDEDKLDHPMGAVWATLVKILNGEEVHGRYLMGAALYIANTLYNVAAGCTQALISQQQAAEADANTSDEEVTADDNENTTA